MQWKESRNKNRYKRIGRSASSEELRLKKGWRRGKFLPLQHSARKKKPGSALTRMTTVADNKSQNVIPASARTGQRNKIMPSKAFCNNNIWNTHKAARLSRTQRTLLHRVRTKLFNSYKRKALSFFICHLKPEPK